MNTNTTDQFGNSLIRFDDNRNLFGPNTAGYRSAIFSICGKYRYHLDIELVDNASVSPCINFVMLNPSTADAFKNDPTVERCCRRAIAGGYGRVIITNLFAYRSTDPSALLDVDDPEGPFNQLYLEIARCFCHTRVFGWGSNVDKSTRLRSVSDRVSTPIGYAVNYCLGMTKSGHPRHPLYVPYSQGLVPYVKM
jgi:hypothetical protein